MKSWAKINSSKTAGFTIVELLIVIIVIGILATLVLVAYSNVSDQAKSSAAKNDLEQIAKQLNLYKENTGAGSTYPADASSLSYSSGTSVQYSVNNSVSPAIYCITATNGNKSFFVSNASQTPTAGGCPGHGQNGKAAVTNVANNPSFESNITGVSSYNVTNTNPTLGDAFSGTRVLRAFDTSTSGTTGPWWDAATPINPGSTYKVSLSTRANVSISRTLNIEWINAAGTGNVGTNAIVANYTPTSSWTRITGSSTAPAGAARLRLTFYGSDTGNTADYVDIDGVMIVENDSSNYNFSDGNSTNWVWNGTTNNATSTGPGQ